MADDKLTAFLADITATAETEIVHPDDECDPSGCTPHGALRMAAALGEVLKAHRNTGDRCAWCRNPDGTRQKWPCGEYLTIIRALTREKASDE
jgi:hypothetical protein